MEKVPGTGQGLVTACQRRTALAGVRPSEGLNRIVVFVVGKQLHMASTADLQIPPHNRYMGRQWYE
jgi:hypothetical protein